MMGLRRRAEAGHVTLFARPGAASSRLQMVSQHGVQLAEQVREWLAGLRGPAGSGDGGETDVV